MSNLDLQAACELLLKVEKKVDVNAISHEDAHLWPLIRQYLWTASIKRENKFEPSVAPSPPPARKNPGYLKHLVHIARGPKIFLKAKIAQKKIEKRSLAIPEKVDFCFLSQPIYYSEMLGGKPYNRIIDPVFETFSSKYNCIKIEEIISNAPEPERAHPCNYFSPMRLERTTGRRVSESIEKAKSIIAEIGNVVGIDEQKLVEATAQRLQIALRYRDTFTVLLKHYQPEMIFLPCYYVPRYMGLLWAAARLGIPTIDIQHGKQGMYQGMYSHWTQIPDTGYTLLPDWFWTWGQASVDNVMKWQRDRASHRCLIGGFPWLARWRHYGWEGESFRRPHAKKVIIITTQAPVGGLEDFFPEFLAETIKQSPDNWFWIIREHPNYPEGSKKIKKRLEGTKSSKYILGQCNKVPLYSLLTKCDFHVTAFSTVCYEAESFSIPTAIFSEIGLKLYEKEINDDRFIYVESAQELLNAVEHFDVDSDKEKYIESDFELMYSVLDTVRAESNRELP